MFRSKANRNAKATLRGFEGLESRELFAGDMLAAAGAEYEASVFQNGDLPITADEQADHDSGRSTSVMNCDGRFSVGLES